MKMYLNGAEIMIKLSGSALKNLLAFLLAVSKEHKKLYGKVNMGRMLQETRDLRTFTMTEKQYKAFKSQAKKQGILFAAVTDKDNKGKVMDVILAATEVDRANVIFERILYDPALGAESPEPPQTEKKHWWQRIFQRGGREEPAQEPTPEAGAGSEHGSGTEHEAGREHGTEPGADSGNPEKVTPSGNVRRRDINSCLIHIRATYTRARIVIRRISNRRSRPDLATHTRARIATGGARTVIDGQTWQLIHVRELQQARRLRAFRSRAGNSYTCANCNLEKAQEITDSFTGNSYTCANCNRTGSVRGMKKLLATHTRARIAT